MSYLTAPEQDTKPTFCSVKSIMIRSSGIKLNTINVNPQKEKDKKGFKY